MRDEPISYRGVMVSSTFADLSTHRAILMDALRKQELFPVAMEDHVAEPGEDVISSSLRMVRKASAYIGLISHRCGQVPQCPKRNPHAYPISRLEFEEAERLHRPTLVFVMAEDHPVTKSNVELDPDKIKKLNEYLERAKAGRIYVEFHSIEDFRAKAIHAVASIRQHIGRKKQHPAVATREKLHTDTASILGRVTAVCRNFTTSQVERYARGKYISGLYVDRAVQHDILDFHAQEAQRAAKEKAHILKLAERTRKDVEDALATLQNEMTRPLLPKGKARSHDERPRRKEDEYREKIDHRRLQLRKRLYRESRPALKNMQNRAAELVRAVTRLPESTLLTDALARGVLSTNTQISEILHRLPSASISPTDAKRLRIPSKYLPSEEEPVHLFPESSRGSIEFSLHEMTQQVERQRRPCFVLVDKAGGGKTNVLCHLALILASRAPTILLFGKEAMESCPSLVARVTDVLAKAFPNHHGNVASALDMALAASGDFLHVFLDGVNETRDIPRFNSWIHDLLRWARDHRVRVLVSCRDIYWPFFNSEDWQGDIYESSHGRLGAFSHDEYEEARPLYLDHFHIHCQFEGHACEVTQHPLLLRFFCEAYGSPAGRVVDMGTIRDIRLKQLFEQYFTRKTTSIRRMLGHQNNLECERFIMGLAGFLFETARSSLTTDEVADVSGAPDMSTDRSIYLRFLDEDIIIEEDPTDDVVMRNVSFVYEEFMEYLLARAFLSRTSRRTPLDVDALFTSFADKARAWPNAVGVAEYGALMLLEGDYGHKYDEGIAFMRHLAAADATWANSFWAVVGKCRADSLRPELFDLFSDALENAHMTAAQRSLNCMCQYSESGSGRLAVRLLWTAALPQVLNWTDLSRLSTMSTEELEALADRLKTASSQRKREGCVRDIRLDGVVDIAAIFSEAKVGQMLWEKRWTYGRPGRDKKLLLTMIWKVFPEFQPMLVNGIASADDRVRAFCADRLQFCGVARRQVAHLCNQLASVEDEPPVRNMLLRAMTALQGGR